MAKEEWGTKRICPDTGKRFYDLNNIPVISPYTGKEIILDKSVSEKIKTIYSYDFLTFFLTRKIPIKTINVPTKWYISNFSSKNKKP